MDAVWLARQMWRGAAWLWHNVPGASMLIAEPGDWPQPDRAGGLIPESLRATQQHPGFVEKIKEQGSELLSQAGEGIKQSVQQAGQGLKEGVKSVTGIGEDGRQLRGTGLFGAPDYAGQHGGSLDSLGFWTDTPRTGTLSESVLRHAGQLIHPYGPLAFLERLGPWFWWARLISALLIVSSIELPIALGRRSNAIKLLRMCYLGWLAVWMGWLNPTSMVTVWMTIIGAVTVFRSLELGLNLVDWLAEKLIPEEERVQQSWGEIMEGLVRPVTRGAKDLQHKFKQTVGLEDEESKEQTTKQEEEEEGPTEEQEEDQQKGEEGEEEEGEGAVEEEDVSSIRTKPKIQTPSDEEGEEELEKEDTSAQTSRSSGQQQQAKTERQPKKEDKGKQEKQEKSEKQQEKPEKQTKQQEKPDTQRQQKTQQQKTQQQKGGQQKGQKTSTSTTSSGGVKSQQHEEQQPSPQDDRQYEQHVTGASPTGQQKQQQSKQQQSKQQQSKQQQKEEEDQPAVASSSSKSSDRSFADVVTEAVGQGEREEESSFNPSFSERSPQFQAQQEQEEPVQKTGTPKMSRSGSSSTQSGGAAVTEDALERQKSRQQEQQRKEREQSQKEWKQPKPEKTVSFQESEKQLRKQQLKDPTRADDYTVGPQGEHVPEQRQQQQPSPLEDEDDQLQVVPDEDRIAQELQELRHQQLHAKPSTTQAAALSGLHWQPTVVDTAPSNSSAGQDKPKPSTPHPSSAKQQQQRAEKLQPKSPTEKSRKTAQTGGSGGTGGGTFWESLSSGRHW